MGVVRHAQELRERGAVSHLCHQHLPTTWASHPLLHWLHIPPHTPVCTTNMLIAAAAAVTCPNATTYRLHVHASHRQPHPHRSTPPPYRLGSGCSVQPCGLEISIHLRDGAQLVRVHVPSKLAQDGIADTARATAAAAAAAVWASFGRESLLLLSRCWLAGELDDVRHFQNP